MNLIVVTLIIVVSILLLCWIATLVYHRIKPTEYVAYLANIAQVSLIAVTVGSFIFVYFQTDQNFRRTIENSDRQFQLVNRPYIQIIPKSLTIVGSADRGGVLPEIEFNLAVNMINHGHLPASVRNVEVVIQSVNNPKEVCPFMPWGETEKMTDLFPYKETLLNDFFGNIFLNLNDVARIMKVDIDFVEQHKDKESSFWKGLQADIARSIQEQLDDFFLIVQIEYKTAGDIGNERLYYHSSKFSIRPNSSSRLSDIEESINGNSPEQGKWFLITQGDVKPYPKSMEPIGKKPVAKTVKFHNGWKDGLKDICLNVLGGFLAAGLTGLLVYIRRRLRHRALRQVFGDDIINAIRSHIVHAEFILRPDIQRNERWPYQKPAGRPPEFSIENPVSGSEARSASYLISTLSKESGRFPSFVPDTQVEGLLDISFITFGGPDSNLKTTDANRNQGNTLVFFDQPNDRMVRVGTTVPLFTREHGFDYGLILKVRPTQFPQRVWIVCAGFGEWGTSGAAWYLSANWKRIHARWKSFQFAIIVKVRPTQDESAEPIFQIGAER